MSSLTSLLCIFWAASLIYGEMLAFWLPSLYTCSWPRPGSLSSGNQETTVHGNNVKIAVLTDPQLMDRTSHKFAPNSFILEILQFYTDLFMRRAFRRSIMPFTPDMILFLGDYFDGGPVLSDEEWRESFSRFMHIFGVKNSGKDIPVYYLVGNHDIGYASFVSRKPQVAERYEKWFGKRSYQFLAGKMEFIAIDSQSIGGLDKLSASSWGFVQNVSKEDARIYPRVLLTHIPLYRPNWSPCGLHRASPIINQRISRNAYNQEIMYQNYISKEVSDLLLEAIKPVLVLSGHDHDQCTMIHQTNFGPVREETVGTISWQQGNLHPSFLLLATANFSLPNSSDAVATYLCFLPTQTYIYIWYLSLLVATIVAALIWPSSKVVYFARDNNTYNIGTKEKDEGGVKRKGVVGGVTKRKGVGKGEGSEYAVSEGGGKLISGERRVRNGVMCRVGRAFERIVVVGAVNVPLYMIMLYIDWVD